MAEAAQLADVAQQPTSSIDKIRLDSNDGQQFIVSRKAAELSKTIKTMLADLDGETSLECGIPLPNVDGATLTLI
uniref:SKP1 component POZ domain-containing protein n=1 Tax=Plectus sambesii TaxID=2011161 RepID=A0A914WBH6_9BILA